MAENTKAFTIPIESENESIKNGIKEAVNSIFPIIGKQRELHLKDITIDDVESDPYNYKAQFEARLKGKTYAAPYHATLELKDKETGKVLDTSKIKFGSLPLVTQRGSYIIDGNEYYTSLIQRRKPGIYAKIAENGIPFVDVNSSKGRNMKILIDDKGILKLKVKTKEIPLLPLLRSLGADDADIKKKFGDKIYTENLSKSHLAESAVNKTHEAFYYDKKPETFDKGIEAIKKYFDESTEFRPEVNKITLGSPYTKFTVPAMLDAAEKLIKLRKLEIEPDDAEHLAFKTLHSTGDILRERIEKKAKDIKFKFVRNVDKGETVSKVMGSSPLDPYVHSTFTEFQNINLGDQGNPVAMTINFHKTTAFGPGGINDEHAVTKENKNVSVSHFGFFDVFHTPEKQAGLVNNLTLGTLKEGTTIFKRVIDKNGKHALVSPTDLLEKAMAFSDQVDFSDGVKPKNKTVRCVKAGKVVELPWDQVDYVMPTHSFYFDHATNMVPFLGNDHGNRSYMAGKHMEQSLPLVHREAPMVQANILYPAAGGAAMTMEDILGHDFSVHAPEAGTVTKVSDSDMVIEMTGESGKKHKVPFYRNFHLNNGSILDSDVLVKPGDKVKAGELMADTNSTKDGVLAIGTNLNVGYLPYKGYNFEDGLVISESAADKLTSEHSTVEELVPEEGDIVSKKAFTSYAPTLYTTEQLKNVGDDGVIKEGSIVNPGDPLILYLKKKVITAENNMLGRISKALNMPYKIAPVDWDYNAPGEVITVSNFGGGIKIVIKTKEPARIGDKLAGRHGNKGVITMILPDEQMPVGTDGTKLDVLYSPIAVLGRTNVGQLLEIAAGKVAKATKKRYIVNNFEDTNFTNKLVDELKKNGISDKGDVKDPVSGKIYKNIAYGPQYMLKLHHMVEHKMSSRYPDKYDANLQPIKGGENSAIAVDRLMFNSFLAHGAKHNLYEAAAYKSEKNDEFWRAFEGNKPLPYPHTPFVFKKLLDMIRATGVDIKKEGTRLQMSPMTSADVLKMSKGAITNPFGYLGKNLAEIEGGIFDPKITGGMKGENWSHIELAEPIPNPLFVEPIKSLTKLNGDQIEGLVEGKLYVTKDGVLNKEGDGMTGAKAIGYLLDRIDLEKRRAELIEKAKESTGDGLNSINKEARCIDALLRLKTKPSEAYLLRHVPVMPPIMRPVYPDKSGRLVVSPINYMYRFILEGSNQLKEMKDLPDVLKQDLRKDIFNNVGALIGLKAPTVRMPGRDYKGIIEIISGSTQPKAGFFQSKIYSKRQDLSARSVISMDNEIHPDEVGLPANMAWDIYRPFITRRLVRSGISQIDAVKRVDEKDRMAEIALQQELRERPVIMNRAPTLHKHGVLAFRPILKAGTKTIQINPLNVLGFNADFDGDAMSIFVPVLEEARIEALGMLPSKHLYNPSKEGKRLMMTPQREAAAGLWFASQMEKKTNKKYANEAEVLKDYGAGNIEMSDGITVAGKETTVGRIRLSKIIPKDISWSSLDKKGQAKLMDELASKHEGEYATLANALNVFGNEVAAEAKVSFGVSDLNLPSMLKDRDRIISEAKKHVGGKVNDKNILKVYGDATREKILGIQDDLPDSNPLRRFTLAGQSKGTNTKGQSMTYQQLIGAPLLIEDIRKNVIPVPVDKSYVEGLPVSQYLTTAFGARQGQADRASSTSEPGAFSKEISSVTIDYIVTEKDCGTRNGIDMSVDDKDIIDRFLSENIPGIGKRNDVVTSDMLSSAKKKNMASLKVRSPLTCQARHGACQMCVGMSESGKEFKVGTNIGIIAGQAMSEPLVQMAMKSFHQGGIYGSATVANAFPIINNILNIPKIYPNATTLANLSGKVQKITKGTLGENVVKINDQEHVVPVGQKLLVGEGDKVEKGQQLGEGVKNPRDVLRILGLHSARNQMVDDLQKQYAASGERIRRRMFEIVVKAATDTTRVMDPGTSKFAPGDYAKLHVVEQYNSSDFETAVPSQSLNRMTYEDLPGIKAGTKITKEIIDKLEKMGYKEVKLRRDPIEHEPSLYGVSQVPINFEEDWVARLGTTHLQSAIMEGAAYAQESNLHGYHPVPAWAAATEFGRPADKDETKY